MPAVCSQNNGRVSWGRSRTHWLAQHTSCTCIKAGWQGVASRGSLYVYIKRPWCQNEPEGLQTAPLGPSFFSLSECSQCRLVKPFNVPTAGGGGSCNVLTNFGAGQILTLYRRFMLMNCPSFSFLSLPYLLLSLPGGEFTVASLFLKARQGAAKAVERSYMLHVNLEGGWRITI